MGFTNSATLVTTTLLGAVIISKAVVAQNVSTPDRYQASINNPPRLEWENNYGYCGEVSFISAGLRFGQYLSQYDARAIASNNTPQYNENSQLLLGDNDPWAAEQLHLKAEPYDNSNGNDADGFLTWIKNGVLSNNSVIIGVYMNYYDFYPNSGSSGDPQYDHIVTVNSVSSAFPLEPDTYHPNDTITFTDNGLWDPQNNPPYIWSYHNGPFQGNRQKANQKSSGTYTLPNAIQNFGTAISGIIDNDGHTLPVLVATSVNYEKPSIKDNSNTRPAAENLTLTVTVSSLQPGQTYNLYRYNSFSNVPNSSFNRNAGQAAQSWQIRATSSTYTLTQSITSNQSVIYRAVPVSAP